MPEHIRQHEYFPVLDCVMPQAGKNFDMELLFRALGDRTRLRLLNLMGEDEVCVCLAIVSVVPESAARPVG